MANEQRNVNQQPVQAKPNQAANVSLTNEDELAFRLFSQRAAMGPLRRNGEGEAMNSYRQARAFLDAQKRVQAGELDVAEPKGPQLANCCAPNLPETHPHNLISQRFGDLLRVATIKKWLDVNPTPASDPNELVTRFNKQFRGMDWDLPTINTARTVFPHYVESN